MYLRHSGLAISHGHWRRRRRTEEEEKEEEKEEEEVIMLSTCSYYNQMVAGTSNKVNKEKGSVCCSEINRTKLYTCM